MKKFAPHLLDYLAMDLGDEVLISPTPTVCVIVLRRVGAIVGGSASVTWCGRDDAHAAEPSVGSHLGQRSTIFQAVREALVGMPRGSGQ